MVSASLWRGEVVVRGVDDEPRRRGRVVEGPVRERLRGHVAVPVVEGGESPGDRRDDRHLLGGVPGHDLRVFLIGGLAAHLRGEHADVIRDEPVHRRRCVRVARRVRSGHLLGHDSPVTGRVDDAEQLGVDVREFLPESGFGVFMFAATPYSSHHGDAPGLSHPGPPDTTTRYNQPNHPRRMNRDGPYTKDPGHRTRTPLHVRGATRAGGRRPAGDLGKKPRSGHMGQPGDSVAEERCGEQHHDHRRDQPGVAEQPVPDALQEPRSPGR